MEKETYKIGLHRTLDIFHTQTFLNSYKIPPVYSERIEGEYHYFDLEFDNQEHKVSFYNALRESAGL